jgi:hypothetical protein
MIPIHVMIIFSFITLGAYVFIMIRRQRKGEETDYRAFYYIGLAFIPVGIALSASTGNPGLLGISGLGVAYLAISFKNRDKWRA